MQTVGDLGSVSLLRLRKAALLAHWLPGVGVNVRQHGRRLVRVSTTPFSPETAHPCLTAPDHDLDPCEFRHVVIRLASVVASLDRPCDDPGPITFGGEVSVEYFTDASAQLGPNGMIRACVTDAMAVIGFASTLTIRQAEAVGLAHGGSVEHEPNALDVHYDHDHELGMTLVHRAFEAHSAAQEQRVFEVLLDLSAICGAEEAARQFEAATRR